MRGHRILGAELVALGIAAAKLARRGQREVSGHVAVERIVRRGLVGHQVEVHAAPEQLGKDLGGVADDAHAERSLLFDGALHPTHGVVEVVGELVEVARLESSLRPRRVDLHAEEGGPGHGRGERLRAAHATEAGREDGPAAQVVRAEVLAARGAEGLVGALQDALRADVDPRAGGHLPIHHQAACLEVAKDLPGGPVGHEVGVGDEHARGIGMAAQDTDRLAALHQQRLVVAEGLERGDDPFERRPVAGGLPRSAVDDQILGSFRHLRVEVVHQHAHGRFLHPALARERRTAGSANGGHVAHGVMRQFSMRCGGEGCTRSVKCQSPRSHLSTTVAWLGESGEIVATRTGGRDVRDQRRCR